MVEIGSILSASAACSVNLKLEFEDLLKGNRRWMVNFLCPRVVSPSWLLERVQIRSALASFFTAGGCIHFYFSWCLEPPAAAAPAQDGCQRFTPVGLILDFMDDILVSVHRSSVQDVASDSARDHHLENGLENEPGSLEI